MTKILLTLLVAAFVVAFQVFLIWACWNSFMVAQGLKAISLGDAVILDLFAHLMRGNAILSLKKKNTE